MIRRRFCSHRNPPSVSVLTPTIQGREDFLKECRASVKAQTFQDHEHLTLLDDEYVGCAGTVNTLAEHAKGGWLLILADDDILLPRCLELMVPFAAGAQICYSPPLVWGEDGTQFCASPPNIPATALISKEFWDTVGGYDVSLPKTEDRDFWCRAETRGPTFRRFDEAPTWIYRFHGGNKSRS